jgi:hypothetical protein
VLEESFEIKQPNLLQGNTLEQGGNHQQHLEFSFMDYLHQDNIIGKL